MSERKPENTRLFPRVLIVAIGRINRSDVFNNGMLLRNLFNEWPRDSLAQVYSSGDNGDEGFCGRYFKLGPRERRLGNLFYKLKKESIQPEISNNGFQLGTDTVKGRWWRGSSFFRRLLVDTGLYELFFKPRLSRELEAWVREFRPDIIFAQGYNLSFSQLPVFIKRTVGARMAFFCSDDWPSYLYSGMLGEPLLFRPMMRKIVETVTRELLSACEVFLAFNSPMAVEYQKRYRKNFLVIPHSDDPQRYVADIKTRHDGACSFNVVAIGGFNKYRCPLLLDADAACSLLQSKGISARIKVMASSIDPGFIERLKLARNIDILPDPGNDLLPVCLRDADVLLLVEGFDEKFVSAIQLSVSSKAHLFMFSKTPTIVYAHKDTGIAQYAMAGAWAKVVTQRDVEVLAEVMEGLLINENERKELAERAYGYGLAHHDAARVREVFRKAMVQD